MNIDWSIYHRLRKNAALRLLAPMFVRGERRQRLKSLPTNIMVHNLAQGIPFPSSTVDAVYHSHVLEHLDQPIARQFLQEVKRVLKPGGVQRIVVPDLQRLCQSYLSHIAACRSNADEARVHDSYVAAILEQCVRREPFGTSHQPPFRRFVENRLLGDARRRGETHQWMYDRVNLKVLLLDLGFSDVQLRQHDSSLIQGWNQYGLDVNEEGAEYKPGSMYMEAQK